MTNPNYNSNTSGGLLQGIAQLLGGINSLRDPKADERARLQALLQQNPQLREQYQQQYANNPEALKALLGRAPLFGKSNYDALQQTITGGQLSPDAIRNQQINQLQAKGVVNNNANDIANANVKSVPELSQFSKPTLQAAAGNGLGMSGNDTQSLQEFNALGRFLTPQERVQQESKLAEQKANTDRALVEAKIATDTAPSRINKDLAEGDEAGARAKLTAAQLDEYTKDRARTDAARTIAQQAIASLGKGENLYTNWKQGKISPDQYNAIQTVPEYAKRYQEDLNETHQNIQLAQQKSISDEARQQRLDMRYNGVASQLMAKTESAGMPLGADVAYQIVKDPKAIMESTDPSTQYIRDALKNMSDYYKKTNSAEIAKTNTSFLNKSNSIITLANEGKLTAEDAINQLNTESQLHYGGMPGIEGPSFSVKQTQKSHLGGLYHTDQDNIVISDPGNINISNKLGLSISKDAGSPTLPPEPQSGYAKGRGVGIKVGSNQSGSTPMININLDALAQDAVNNNWDDSVIESSLKGQVKDPNQVAALMTQFKQLKITKKKAK